MGVQTSTTVVGGGDLGLGFVELHGHPLVCSNDGGCGSQLRILTVASTHYGVLRTLLDHVYTARRSHWAWERGYGGIAYCITMYHMKH